jgi:hypothetical protein
MKGWTRLGLFLSALWVVGVFVFTILTFFNIPSSACRFYNSETLGGAAPPAVPIDLEPLHTYFFSCNEYTDIFYPHPSWKSGVILEDTQLIEFNTTHFIMLLFIPLASVWAAAVSLIKSVRWVKNGFKK